MSGYLAYPQRFEELYKIYDGPKQSTIVRKLLGQVLTILL